MRRDVVVVGSSGHAKVVADIVEASGDNFIGFLDNDEKIGTKVLDRKIIGDDTCISELCKNGVMIVLGIGNNQIRKRFDKQYKMIHWYTAIHPSSFISSYAKIGEGTVIMPKAIVDTEAQVGRHCIINSGAIVEHEDKIGDYAHICPNASLAGRVDVGECSQIGIGASVREGTMICSNVIVGAGSVVVKDIVKGGKYIGVPISYIEE